MLAAAAFHEKTTSCQQKSSLQVLDLPVPGTRHEYDISEHGN